jgi:hypothetical protein
VKLTCNDNDIPTNLSTSESNGPPSAYMVAPSSSDPASTLLNIIMKGANLNEVMFSNRLAIIYAGAMVSQFTNTTVCKATFNNNAKYILSGSTGLMVNSVVELKYQTPQWYEKTN